MGKKMIPCRICGKCGRYHDASVRSCSCGADLCSQPFTVTDFDSIAAELRGSIDPELQIYVQKCSRCGAESFTADPKQPVQQCSCCGSSRIAAFDPIPYNSGQEDAPPQPAPAPPAEDKRPPITGAEQRHESVTVAPEAVDRVMGILGNVSAALGGAPAPVQPAPTTPPPRAAEPVAPGGTRDDDEDDEEGFRWDPFVQGNKPDEVPMRTSPAPAPAEKAPGTVIRFSAIRYGTFTAELHADQEGLPLLIGRYAAWGEFLEDRDLRVSGEHCYISYRDGEWYVRDDSTNGTMVNGVRLHRGGEHVLRNGDTLTLGHSGDSMAFRVSVGG